jgi:hypothetical protein
MVHLDNSRESEAALTVTKTCRIPAPAYSPDLSPSEFFVFGMFEERMSRISYSLPDEMISAISELIESLPKDQFASVHKNWMKRLNSLLY